MRKLYLKDITDIEISGIDHGDYPDFCDAYIQAACDKKDEIPLTDEELEWVQDNDRDNVAEYILMQAVGA